MSVPIHIISTQEHEPDPFHRGWICTPPTIFATVVLGVYSPIGTSAAAAPYNPAGHQAWHVYGLNSGGQFILITIDLILEDIFTGNSGLCIANYQLALGQIMGVGASVGPVAGRGGGRSGGSKCRRWTGSASMGAGRSNGGYSREPGRGGIGAGASRSSNNVWPSRCSGSAGP